jgi:hypothetical protein
VSVDYATLRAFEARLEALERRLDSHCLFGEAHLHHHEELQDLHALHAQLGETAEQLRRDVDSVRDRPAPVPTPPAPALPPEPPPKPRTPEPEREPKRSHPLRHKIGGRS